MKERKRDKRGLGFGVGNEVDSNFKMVNFPRKGYHSEVIGVHYDRAEVVGKMMNAK